MMEPGSFRKTLIILAGPVSCVSLACLLHYVRETFFPCPLAAARKEQLATIHRVIRMNGEAAKSMTLGELAKDLRGYGGVWQALADHKEYCDMKSPYFMSLEPKYAFAVGKGGMESNVVMPYAHVELEEAVAVAAKRG